MTAESARSTQDHPTVEATGRGGVEADLELYRAFVDAAPQFIALAGLDGSVMYLNPGGRRIAGIPDDVDVTATTIADYLTHDGLVASVEVEQPAVRRDGRWEGESTLRHWPTGEGIPVRVSSFLVTDPTTGSPGALATVQSDLREVVAARQAMQSQVAHQRGLLLHLQEAQEAERQRIAGEIHDDTVQVMAALNLRLQTLRRSLAPSLPAKQAADLAALDQSVRDATGRLRRLLVDLDAPPLTAEAVGEALHTAVRSTFGAGPPVAEVDVRVSTEPTPVVGRVLMRIVREALANVVKHAGAEHVQVELREESGEYLLRVLDDGRGMVTGEEVSPLHRGLRTMHEQAESVGGELAVVARTDGGTLVESRLPHLLGHPEQALTGASSRMFLEQVMESIPDAYCAIGADWRYVFMNQAGYALLNRDPADSLVGKVIWDELEIAPEFAAAYRRARTEQVPVEITGYHAPWDRWIYNRVLPTAGGLSIFARDVTEERRQARLISVGRDLVAAVIAPTETVDGLREALEALVAGWPLTGVRLRSVDGRSEVVVGDVSGGSARRVDLVVSGSPVGTAEVFGEVDPDPVDRGMMQLIALRLAAGLSTRRDGGWGAEPAEERDRSHGHGPDPA
jgi:signal transduction histidine kinase